MPKKMKTRTGTIEDLLRGRSPKVCQWTKALRRLVRSAVPGCSERVYMGWRVIMYSRGKISLGKPVPMSTMFCGIMPLKDSVSLYFLQGAKLPDPDGLLAGTGKGMRHVKIRDWKQIRPTANKKLVRAAYQFMASS